MEENNGSLFTDGKPLRMEPFYLHLFETRKAHIIQQMLHEELLSIPGFLRFPVT